ncbi:MAG: hypothetical protein CVU63_08825, partial [Deltaproteobacteria bacterium HGW-Deltaproteobacteria-20]
MTPSTRALASSVALLASLLGCSVRLSPPTGEPLDGPPQRGGTLTLSTFVGIRSIDPAVAFDEGSEPIVRLLFARLFRVSRTGEIEGDLVENHRLSPDGLELTMELRRDARFHDGSPVLASDVKRSFERAFHPKTPCPVPSFFDRIAGFTAYRKGDATELSGVAVLSDHVVRITLREPDATLLPILTLGTTAPVCRSAGHVFDPKFNQTACGAGPFRLASWQGREAIELRRHDGYHGASAVHLDGIRWLFGVPSTSQRFRFERGELDIVHELTAADAVAFRADPRWNPLGAWSRPRSTRGIFMNTELPPFHDARVRRAVAHAIDRDQVASLRAGHLVASNSMIPSGVVGHDPSFQGQHHDLQLSLDLMRQAGWAYDPISDTGGYPEPIDYYCAADSFDVAVAEWVEPSGLEGAVARLVREEGCQIVFGTYIDDTEALARIARSYPQVIFEGYRGAWIQDKPPNLGTYDFSEEAMYYLQGFLAGALSAKGKIGYLAISPGNEEYSVLWANLFAL